MDRKFIQKSRIIEKEFDNGYILNCAFGIEELKEMAKDGWVNIVIGKRREVSEKGVTHYAYEDEFKPKKDIAARPESKDYDPF
tara:strand:+ start:406 stop:654 length:249 start_codon:yes stop_codon:yes gene_type:complete